MFSQDYYELTKRTIGANGNIYQTSKPNNFRDVHNLYRDKAIMDITLKRCKLFTFTPWNEQYQPHIFDMKKDQCTGRYRVGLNVLLVPDSNPKSFFRTL